MAAFRFLIVLTAVQGGVATQDSCVSLQATAACGSVASLPPCQSLEDILLDLSSGQWPGMCVIVDLLDGVHSLTTPVYINATNVSLTIVGSTSSNVSCTFNSSNTTNLHSIHLYGLGAVVVSSVNVHGCDRPIRLQNIEYLHINNSIFRCVRGGGGGGDKLCVYIYFCIISSARILLCVLNDCFP